MTTRLATVASGKAEAQLAFHMSCYRINTRLAVEVMVDESTTDRLGNKETGEGFWDAMFYINGIKRRIVHFGPWEYVGCHFHDQDEQFKVTQGSAHVFIWDTVTRTWAMEIIQPNHVLNVHAGTPHALLATDPGHGLTMYAIHTDFDRQTTIFTDCEPVPWEMV